MQNKLISVAQTLLPADANLSRFFTREESLTVTDAFIPKTGPIFVADPGIRQASGWFYFLWSGSVADKMVLRSSHPGISHKKYFVKHWNAEENPSRQDIESVVARDAEGLQEVILRNGVVTKRGYIENKIHVWCANG
jgi:hypothetical protein